MPNLGIWKQFCHIWSQLPRIYLIAKFRGKTKMPKFWTKNDLFGYFWPKMLKYLGIFGLESYCHIWNQHPQICLIAKLVENESLTHTINFVIGSTFSKGLGLAFSKGPGPGPGPGTLYVTGKSIIWFTVAMLYSLVFCTWVCFIISASLKSFKTLDER